MTASIEMAYPLHWPEGFPRRRRREVSRFRTTFGVARDRLLREFGLLGARYIVISSNIPVRRDGLPYADHRQPDDPGVAVYFDLKGGQRVMACDRWSTACDNVVALAHTVEAMRGIARWGSTEMLERAFSAFQALPPAATDWRAVLGATTLEEARRRHRALAFEAHPDRRGGSEEAMKRLNVALEAAERELGGGPR